MSKLKNGFTTGTCAAIAAKAAARMIFEKRVVMRESLITPDGTLIDTETVESEYRDDRARCGVKKDAGDDPDVTDGLVIFSEVRLLPEKGILIKGGEGVGRVTKPGLQQEVGEAAINKVPREMISSAVKDVMDSFGYEGGAEITVSVPGGEETAKKTFNPRLGIEGGISILGSSGIVKPMSEDAIIETIRIEINMRAAGGEELLILTPGNYGRDFLAENYSVDIDKAVMCSNYIGEALDAAVEKGFKKILLTGHAGKLIKCAGGIMNTHSRNADCRMEIIAANTAFFTDSTDVLRKILSSVSTDEAAAILKDKGILNKVMDRIGDRALFYINNRLEKSGEAEAGLIIFSNEHGVLTEKIPESIDRLIKRRKGTK